MAMGGGGDSLGLEIITYRLGHFLLYAVVI